MLVLNKYFVRATDSNRKLVFTCTEYASTEQEAEEKAFETAKGYVSSFSLSEWGWPVSFQAEIKYE